MEAILTALGEQHAELDALLDPLDDQGWQRPTRCEGWDVADVVLHLAQTDELALASAQGRFDEGLQRLAGGLDGPGNGRAQIAGARRGEPTEAVREGAPERGGPSNVDDGAAAMVADERGGPNGALLARWRGGAAAVRAALAASDPHRRVGWVAGQLSTRTLAATRLAECWIHTGDVAGALGVEPAPTDRLEHIARLAWRTLPYAFAQAGRAPAGPVAFDLRAPSGARWQFVPDTEALTTIEGPGADLCLVAARRVPPGETQLHGTGPDASAVLDLVRTYA